MQVGQGKGIIAVVEHLLGVVVKKLAVAFKNFGGADSQRAVHKDGHVRRQLALLIEHMQAVEHLLGALYRKGRDNDLLALAVAVGNGFGQFRIAQGLIFVVAVAVGGFHEDVVRLRGLFRVAHDKGLGPPDVARKDHTGGASVFVGLQTQAARTQDVPGVVVSDADARCGLKGLVVVHGLKEAGGFLCVLGGVEGGGRVGQAAPQILSGFALRFHFLNMSAVFQHELQQFARGAGAVDGLGVALAHHLGQQAGVVDVGMRDKDEIDVLGPVGLGVPVAGFNRLIALVHAAVHAKALAVGFDHITGTGHGLRRAQKLNFHAGLRKLSPQGGPPPHPDAGVGRRLFHSRKGRAASSKPRCLWRLPHLYCAFKFGMRPWAAPFI